jgi:hypothetical protein
MKRQGGHFVSEDELRKLDQASLSSILRGRIVGTGIVYYHGAEYLRSLRGAGINGNESLNRNDIRSPKGCWVVVYLDGIPLWNSPPSLPPEMARFSPQNLAGIEYYSSAQTPVEYKNLINDCGVLLLWTRER